MPGGMGSGSSVANEEVSVTASMATGPRLSRATAQPRGSARVHPPRSWQKAADPTLHKTKAAICCRASEACNRARSLWGTNSESWGLGCLHTPLHLMETKRPERETLRAHGLSRWKTSLSLTEEEGATTMQMRATSLGNLSNYHWRGNGNPLQNSCLENPMDRGAWWATVHGVTRVRHDWATFTYFTIEVTSFFSQTLVKPGKISVWSLCAYLYSI